jgi:hypothetical protein
VRVITLEVLQTSRIWKFSSVCRGEDKFPEVSRSGENLDRPLARTCVSRSSVVRKSGSPGKRRRKEFGVKNSRRPEGRSGS